MNLQKIKAMREKIKHDLAKLTAEIAELQRHDAQLARQEDELQNGKAYLPADGGGAFFKIEKFDYIVPDAEE